MQDRHYFDQQMNGETPDMNTNQAILNHPVAIYSREYDESSASERKRKKKCY